MMSILDRVLPAWREYKWELIVFFIVATVALLSFGLGYTMAKDSARTPIIIEKNSGE